ncbi:MAG TPA: MraY family glycosyltransferase [Candidatus Polarisedimenticolaceae bacterium]|nr:MraY family glycosyltransferase [Candidatus Polarisedimenticolaceae bacterium]
MKRALLELLTFVVACAVALWLTPRVREAAIRFGIVDRPDGQLKTQKTPVAYLGGLAIYLAFLLALALTVPFSQETLGILLAGSIVVLIGLVDDLGGLRPWTKLAGQAVAVIVLVKAGIFIKLTFLPEPVAIGLSIVWLLACTNAFNLIDIMDGLSAGTAIVASVALIAIATWNGREGSALVLAALAGSCLGFLRYNFQPASIYMGDCGSLLLGLTLGATAMNNAYTQTNRLAAVAPALILGVPLFDMLFVMYVRHRRGLPVMLGSPDHVALRLRKWRLSTRKTVGVSYVATGVLGAAALGMSAATPAGAAWILGGVALAALAVAAWLKTIDMSL